MFAKSAFIFVIIFLILLGKNAKILEYYREFYTGTAKKLILTYEN